MSRVYGFSATDLREAINDVAAHRHHEDVPLAVALADMPTRQASCTAMLRRMAYQRMPPESWAELLVGVCHFIDPLVSSRADRLDAWDPATQTGT